MREKINYLRHFAVLSLTIIIFFLGVFIGNQIEQLRVEDQYNLLQNQNLEYQSILTENRYIDYLVSLKKQGKNISCRTISGAYYTSISNLGDARLKLEEYINVGKSQTEEYQRLKDYYANLQVNYWILANSIGNLCDVNMNTILYFYAEDKKCPSCEDQGVHLTYVKQKLDDSVLVFSFDAEKQGPIQLLAQNYKVYDRELPVLVINERVYPFSTNQEIFKILCKNGLKSEVCEN